MTNVLVEGGGQLLGSLLDADAIDEVHAFVATKMVGGANAPSPIAGIGLPQMAAARHLQTVHCEMIDGDIYLHGRVEKKACDLDPKVEVAQFEPIEPLRGMSNRATLLRCDWRPTMVRSPGRRYLPVRRTRGSDRSGGVLRQRR